MLQLDKLALTDYALYKEQEFLFEPGLTVVRGQNFSGKSLLFQPIRTLLFDEGSVPAGGRAVLSGLKDDVSFDISAWSSGKSNRYAISIDGRDQKTDTIAKARTVIDKFVDMPSSLYTTTIGLTGLTPHPLASGKPSTRLEWIHSTLAFAELYDAYMEKVEARIKETKSKAIEHDVLSKELQRLMSEEPSNPSKPPKGDEDLSARLADLQRQRGELSSLLNGPPEPTMSLEEVTSKLSRVTTKLRELEEQDEEWQKYLSRFSKWRETVDSQKEAIDKVQRLAKKLSVPEELRDDFHRLAVQVEKRLAATRSKIEEGIRINRKYREQAEIREILSSTAPDDTGTTSEISARIEEVSAKISYYEVSLSSVGDVCVFCGKDMSSSKEDATTKLSKLKRKRKSLISALKYAEAKEVALVKKIDISSLEQRLEDLTEMATLLKGLSKDLPAKPTKPVKVDTIRLDKLRRRREELLEVKTAAQVYSRWRTNVPENLLSIKNPQKKFDRVETELKELTTQFLAVSDRLVAYRTTVAIRSKWEREVEELSTRVKELSKYPRRMKVLSLLRQAFGRDGLRADTLSSSMELFIANLNDLAKVIWPEPYKFDIDLGPRKCDVVVHRNNRRGSIFSLSGAEQRGWQLISALSLIRLLPLSSRCDTIMLDELEANSSKETRQRFVYDFLPELQRSVPKVVIVSPLNKDEFAVPCDREYSVVKKNAQSYLRQR